MRNLKITKILLTLMLMLGLTTSSFAMSKPDKNVHNKPKVEHKVNKKDLKIATKHHDKHDVKIVKVYTDNHHHKPHHQHHDKVVYYSNNSAGDVAAMAIGTGLCLAMIAALSN